MKQCPWHFPETCPEADLPSKSGCEKQIMDTGTSILTTTHEMQEWLVEAEAVYKVQIVKEVWQPVTQMDV